MGTYQSSISRYLIRRSRPSTEHSVGIINNITRPIPKKRNERRDMAWCSKWILSSCSMAANSNRTWSTRSSWCSKVRSWSHRCAIRSARVRFVMGVHSLSRAAHRPCLSTRYCCTSLARHLLPFNRKPSISGLLNHHHSLPLRHRSRSPTACSSSIGDR